MKNKRFSEAEMIFGRLKKSNLHLNLQNNQFTFKVDFKCGRFLGSVVKLNEETYESCVSADGINSLIRTSAEKHGFEYVTAVDAGLFKK